MAKRAEPGRYLRLEVNLVGLIGKDISADEERNTREACRINGKVGSFLRTDTAEKKDEVSFRVRRGKSFRIDPVRDRRHEPGIRRRQAILAFRDAIHPQARTRVSESGCRVPG